MKDAQSEMFWKNRKKSYEKTAQEITREGNYYGSTYS